LHHQEKSRVWAGYPNGTQAKGFYTAMAKELWARLKLAPAGGDGGDGVRTPRSGFFTYDSVMKQAQLECLEVPLRVLLVGERRGCRLFVNPPPGLYS
jgi:hypothetical protein